MELQDWLDTVLEYLKVFAWPAVVLTLALVFRSPLVEVLHRLHKAAGFGASVELERTFEQSARSLNEVALPDLAPARAEAKDPEQPELHRSSEPQHAPKSEAPQGGQDPLESDHRGSHKEYWTPEAVRAFWRKQPARAAELGLRHPDVRSSDAENYGSMMLAWAHLETKAVRLGELIGLSSSSSRNLGVLSGKLLDRGLVSHEAAEIARSLQRLRNELAHEVERISISPMLTSDFVETAEKLDIAFAHIIEDLEDAAEM